MAVRELALVRAAVSYLFREESLKAAAERECVVPVTLKRWLAAAGLEVRASAEQLVLDQLHGRYEHSAALRSAWARGGFSTEAFRTSRAKGDWGLPRNGEDNSFNGRRHTAATREMLSLQAMERCIPSIGEYGPDWTEELRAQIMSRDQGCCQLCGAVEALQVHHVDLNRANSEPRNLLTLCASCHLGYHGRGEQIDEMVAARATMLERERLNVGSAP